MRTTAFPFPTTLLNHQHHYHHHRTLFPTAAVVAVASLVASHFVRSATTASETATSAFAMPASTEAYSPSSIASARKERLVYGSNDALFGHIEAQQGTKPFGSFLDAGTGVHSLRWIATLASDNDDSKASKQNSLSKLASKYTSTSTAATATAKFTSISTTTMTDFTAVTADETMRRNCQKEVDELGMSHLGKVVIGNWFPPDGDDKQSLSMIDIDEEGNPKRYDTILADYLIGAMDGFSPYSQDQMIDKLAKRLKPGGRLYIVGLQPIPDSFGNDPKIPQNIICEVRKVRDACILLSGDRCYREYPLDWIERRISETTTMTESESIMNDTGERQSNTVKLKLLDSMKFPIMYRHTTIVKQINVGRSKLVRFSSKTLANEMRKLLDSLEKRSKEATEKIPSKRIQLGFDYVVTAERPMPTAKDS